MRRLNVLFMHRLISVFLYSIIYLLALTTVTHASATEIHKDLELKVNLLAGIYISKGQSETVNSMKEFRNQMGRKVIFSMIEVGGNNHGKILYHPTPFVTGNNIQVAEDAEGRQPGKKLLDKALSVKPNSPFWLKYSVKNPARSQMLRQICCIRVDDAAICGSIPSDPE